MTQDAADRKWMRRAIALARQSEGHTRPNPPVGAVVVRDGRKLGEGRHRCAGQAHAEVAAFDACRVPARGATLYVTLEPCSTHGRTPPCTSRILSEGITRVVVGCRDENASHCGRGLEILAGQGIEVVCGVCEREARELVRPFFKHITTGLPFVTLKLAMTLDGRIADRERRSQWITGEAARAEVQRMRRRADAMLIGAGTVCADDPSLLCRIRGGGELARVVVDASGRTPADAKIYTDAAASRTIIATTPHAASLKGTDWSHHGAQVWTVASGKDGRIPLKHLLKRLGDAGHLHVLCEGGGELAGALHDAGLVDEYAFFYAPAILGDTRALSGVSGCGTLLADIQRLRITATKRLGEDIMINLRPLPPAR